MAYQKQKEMKINQKYIKAKAEEESLYKNNSHVKKHFIDL